MPVDDIPVKSQGQSNFFLGQKKKFSVHKRPDLAMFCSLAAPQDAIIDIPMVQKGRQRQHPARWLWGQPARDCIMLRGAPPPGAAAKKVNFFVNFPYFSGL